MAWEGVSEVKAVCPVCAGNAVGLISMDEPSGPRLESLMCQFDCVVDVTSAETLEAVGLA